jgi:hypothetical protein
MNEKKAHMNVELTGALGLVEDDWAAVEKWEFPKAEIWGIKNFNFFAANPIKKKNKFFLIKIQISSIWSIINYLGVRKRSDS